MKDYIVDLWGTAFIVKSEDSRNAVFCALIRGGFALNTVTVTKEVKPKANDIRLVISVLDTETKKVTKYRAQIQK